MGQLTELESALGSIAFRLVGDSSASDGGEFARTTAARVERLAIRVLVKHAALPDDVMSGAAENSAGAERDIDAILAVIKRVDGTLTEITTENAILLPQIDAFNDRLERRNNENMRSMAEFTQRVAEHVGV